MIDIGGPAMIRAAAKNHEFVTVLTDPSDYAIVLDELRVVGHHVTRDSPPSGAQGVRGDGGIRRGNRRVARRR